MKQETVHIDNYYIQTDETGRICAYSKGSGEIFDPDHDFYIESLPEGVTEENIFDYLYANGMWIYDPRPPAPSTDRVIMIGKTALRFPG